jgi:hypothetical protein
MNGNKKFRYTTILSLFVTYLNLEGSVITLCITNFDTKNSKFCPRSLFMCFVRISGQTAIIYLYSIN